MRFLIKQKYFSIRDGFYITDENGRNCYFVQGKFFSIGKQLTIFDESGREILFIKQKIFHWLGNFNVFQGNDVVANIKRTTPFIKRYKITSEKYGDMRLKGNIVAWNFSIVDSQERAIATISKKFLRIRDTYSVDVYSRSAEPLALAIAVILDAIHHKRH